MIDLDAVARSFADPEQDRRIKQGYLRWFAPAARVLDVGCGDGVFLDVLAASGRSGVGIDRRLAARTSAHQVLTGDLIDVLAGLAEQSDRFDGALLAHLVEHLDAPTVVRVLEALREVLGPGARVVISTPNVANRIVLEETFWLDPTHVRPYPRALLARLAAGAGYRVVHSGLDPESVPLRGRLKSALARLRSLLSGADRSSPLDAVVVVEC